MGRQARILVNYVVHQVYAAKIPQTMSPIWRADFLPFYVTSLVFVDLAFGCSNAVVVRSLTSCFRLQLHQHHGTRGSHG